MGINRVAVIGSGTMGYSLALAFAAGGKDVTLVGRREAALIEARRRILEAAHVLCAAGIATFQEPEQLLAKVATVTDLGTAGVRDADWIIEAIPEKSGEKQALVQSLESLVARDTFITTTTSALPIAEIARGAKHPGRILTTHFFNPPHLIPLVEVIAHPQTEPDNVNIILSELKSLRFQPILLKKEVPGFVVNRLQVALMREALYMVEQGIVDEKDIDSAVKNALGLRLPLMGPFETLDFIGLDVAQMVGTYLSPHLAIEMSVKALQDKVEAGHLGVKSGHGFYEYDNPGAAVDERDRQLIQLIKWKQTRGI